MQFTTISNRNYHITSCFINRKYSNKVKDESHIHLFGFLVEHLKKHHELPEINLKNVNAHSLLAVKILEDVKLNNLKKSEKLQSIQKVFGNIVSETMLSIMNRTPGSEKGMMYYRDLYNEEQKTNEGYVDSYFDIARNIQNYEYTHFTFGDGGFYHFVTKSDVPASKALESLLDGPTAIDCGSCIEIVYLKSILTFLGEEKFDKLFNSEQNRMQIRKWVSVDLESSLFPFLEFVDPFLLDETNESSLEVGDHVTVRGVPWYGLKHPEGSMQNLHGLVVDYNKANEPLIGGLELKEPLTIEQIKGELVDCYNAEQTSEDLEFADKVWGDLYLTEKHIDSFFTDIPDIKKLNKSEIFKKYTVDEIKTAGGCIVKNEHSCRISPIALNILKETTDPQMLLSNLGMAKTLILAKEYLKALNSSE